MVAADLVALSLTGSLNLPKRIKSLRLTASKYNSLPLSANKLTKVTDVRVVAPLKPRILFTIAKGVSGIAPSVPPLNSLSFH